MFAEQLHIRPWEIGRLLIGELHQARYVFDRQIAEAEEARKQK